MASENPKILAITLCRPAFESPRGCRRGVGWPRIKILGGYYQIPCNSVNLRSASRILHDFHYSPCKKFLDGYK